MKEGKLDYIFYFENDKTFMYKNRKTKETISVKDGEDCYELYKKLMVESWMVRFKRQYKKHGPIRLGCEIDEFLEEKPCIKH